MTRHIVWGMAAEARHRLIDNSDEFFEGETVAPFNEGLFITTPDGDGIMLEGQPEELEELLTSMAESVAKKKPEEDPLPPGRPSDDMLWRLATWKVMRHMGYTDDEIVRAESQDQHKESGCDFDGQNWTCEDENGKSLHPVADELDSVAQILEVGLDFFRVDLPALRKN